MQKIYIHHAIMLFLVAGLFSSCITNKQKKYLQEENRSTYDIQVFEQYQLRINDEVAYYLITTNQESQNLFNSGQSAFNSSSRRGSTYRIYEDGTIYLPFVGQVEIAGLTVRDAQKLLTSKFRHVVPDAEVRLALVNNYFYVLGDGGKGQYYMYKENLNIYQALAMAGDISSTGDKKNIKIVRKNQDGMDIVKTFDLRKESVIESEFYYVRPNDVIYVPTNSNSFFRVESLSSFIAMFVSPISLLYLVFSTFN